MPIFIPDGKIVIRLPLMVGGIIVSKLFLSNNGKLKEISNTSSIDSLDIFMAILQNY